ncbi:DUF3006 family protein [Ornithinibacillus halotolerans]|nr:DUF3006 family protein [Ornithinibacillus halotolerans]
MKITFYEDAFLNASWHTGGMKGAVIMKKVVIFGGVSLLLCLGLITFCEAKLKEEMSSQREEAVVLTGVVDRIEDEKTAVILIEDMKIQLEVPVSEFAIDFVPNLWLDVVLINDDIDGITVNHERTHAEHENMRKLFERLKKRIKKIQSKD